MHQVLLYPLARSGNADLVCQRRGVQRVVPAGRPLSALDGGGLLGLRLPDVCALLAFSLHHVFGNEPLGAGPGARYRRYKASKSIRRRRVPVPSPEEAARRQGRAYRFFVLCTFADKDIRHLLP